jgi:quercetin dioxygenase-like cupin family protein
MTDGETTWDDERGRVAFRTLAAGEGLTLGIARIAPGDELREHRHEPAEIYVVLAGEGVVTIEGEPHAIAAGDALHIPGNARHSCRNSGRDELRFAYVLAADSFDDVEYVFST